jgi:hypothetical protein
MYQLHLTGFEQDNFRSYINIYYVPPCHFAVHYFIEGYTFPAYADDVGVKLKQLAKHSLVRI